MNFTPFIDLGSDIDYIQFGGKWGYRSKSTGDWYVVRFSPQRSVFGNQYSGYMVEILWIENPSNLLDDSSFEKVNDVLSVCGYKMNKEGIVDCCGELFSKNKEEQMIVEACLGYGKYSLLDSYETDEDSEEEGEKLLGQALEQAFIESGDEY